MDQSQASAKFRAEFLIRPFEWKDWNAMWKLRGYQLAEAGVIIDNIAPGLPDFSISYDESNSSYHEIDMDRIDEAYLKARGNFWIAWMGDHPLGYVGAQDCGEFIELRRMYVRKEYRQRGIGTLLVKALIEHCIDKKVKRIELWTAPDDLGRLLYAKMGFHKVEANGSEPAYEKRASSEIRMRLELPGEL